MHSYCIIYGFGANCDYISYSIPFLCSVPNWDLNIQLPSINIIISLQGKQKNRKNRQMNTSEDTWRKLKVVVLKTFKFELILFNQ